MDDAVIKNNILNLVKGCADVSSGDRVLVITDNTTEQIGERITIEAGILTERVKHINISDKMISCHGDEPPDHVSDELFASDKIFCLTRMSLAHTRARQKATDRGACFLSLPFYSWEVLSRKALSADFRSLTGIAEEMGEIFNSGNQVNIWTEAGTDMCLKIEGRKANVCPGWCYTKGIIASPPDAEVNIAPIEELSKGLVVADGSITCTEIGLLKNPVPIEIEGGRIKEMGDEITPVFMKEYDEKKTVIGEFGIGINPYARLCGMMLEDEGTLGTVHFGFGSNVTIGGLNNIGFHLDVVVRDANVEIDGKKIVAGNRLLI